MFVVFQTWSRSLKTLRGGWTRLKPNRLMWWRSWRRFRTTSTSLWVRTSHTHISKFTLKVLKWRKRWRWDQTWTHLVFSSILLSLPWADVSQEISDAKRAADAANTTATQVNDALRPIKEQLDQWQQTYGDANATNDDINNALMEANKTGRSLKKKKKEHTLL